MPRTFNRILFRWHLGLPMRQASEEEKKKIWELIGKLFDKWKSEGVKTIGTFTCSAHPENFSHFMIFEVDNIEKMTEMDRDICMGEVGKYIETFSLIPGFGSSERED